MTAAFTHRHGSIPPLEPDKLLAFSFRKRPLFRMGYDSHVRLWDEAVRRAVWVKYWTEAEFQAAYHARLSQWYEEVRAA